MNDTTKLLKDAAYVTIGAGVLLFQKAQVQRQELQKQLESQVGDAREGFSRISDTLEDRIKLVEERLEGLQGQVEQAVSGIETNVDKYLDDLEERLPEQARTLVARSRTAAKDAQAQVRSMVA